MTRRPPCSQRLGPNPSPPTGSPDKTPACQNPGLGQPLPVTPVASASASAPAFITTSLFTTAPSVGSPSRTPRTSAPAGASNSGRGPSAAHSVARPTVMLLGLSRHRRCPSGLPAPCVPFCGKCFRTSLSSNATRRHTKARSWGLETRSIL